MRFRTVDMSIRQERGSSKTLKEQLVRGHFHGQVDFQLNQF